MANKRANGEGNVRQRKNGQWEARYTDTRELDPKKRLKYVTAKSQKEVMSKLKTALSYVEDNEPIVVKDKSTVGEWLPFWLKEYKIMDLRDSTYEVYERQITKDIIPLIGHIKLAELSGLHIQKMYNKLQESKEIGGHGLGSASVTKVKNILSGAIKQAITNRMIRNNPLLEANPPKVEDAEIRVLTKNEQKQFLSVLSFYNSGNMFAVSLATGMRIGELCALTLNDIDRENRLIHITKSAGRRKDKYSGDVGIKVGAPKTKNSIRKIPLLASVEVILDRQEQLVSQLRNKAGDKWIKNTLVFPTDIGNIHDLSGLRSSLKRIVNRAGLPHLTIHSLRHTYATTALNAGVAAQNVARLLGHKDGATTLKFYAHYINTEAMTQLEKLEEQNISHLGITAGELERVVVGAAIAMEQSSVSELINNAVLKSKNQSTRRSVDLVLSVCEDILCQPLDRLTAADKDIFLGAFAQYTIMKRQIVAQERSVKQNNIEAR